MFPRSRPCQHPCSRPETLGSMPPWLQGASWAAAELPLLHAVQGGWQDPTPQGPLQDQGRPPKEGSAQDLGWQSVGRGRASWRRWPYHPAPSCTVAQIQLRQYVLFQCPCSKGQQGETTPGRGQAGCNQIVWRHCPWCIQEEDIEGVWASGSRPALPPSCTLAVSGPVGGT